MLRSTTTEARIAASLLVGGLFVVVLASFAHAKQGMVVTRDHHTFLGDIDETKTPGKVQIDSPAVGKISMDARNIEQIIYFNSPAEEFKARVSVLGPRDAAGRVDLANFAIQNNMLPQARELLVSALQIEPANRTAADQLKRVDEQLKAAHPVETQPAQTQVTTTVRPGLLRAKRMLTPEEINELRQMDWQGPEKDPNVRVQITPEVRKAAIDLSLIDASQIQNYTPAQIGWAVLQGGPPNLRAGVKLANDPVSLADYRTRVQRFVIANCATGACHNGAKGGNFYLFTEPAQNDAVVLSDYVVLQQYTKTITGVEFSMIDRLHPTDSLVLQFALPSGLGKVAHPRAAGYVAPAKPPINLRAVEDWIRSLSPVAQPFDVDLAAPAKPATTRPSK